MQFLESFVVSAVSNSSPFCGLASLFTQKSEHRVLCFHGLPSLDMPLSRSKRRQGPRSAFCVSGADVRKIDTAGFRGAARRSGALRRTWRGTRCKRRAQQRASMSEEECGREKLLVS
eukprot:scaffold1627_cov238-Pinguiococcus_pyrenoidosus.AAC.2